MDYVSALRMFAKLAALVSGAFAVFLLWVIATTYPVGFPDLLLHFVIAAGLAVFVLWTASQLPHYNQPRRGTTWRDRVLNFLD